MSDRRRAEIEAKRQKLAELRKARAERQAAETERKSNAETVPSSSSYRRADVDELVRDVLGTPRSRPDSLGGDTPGSIPGTPYIGRPLSPSNLRDRTPPNPSVRSVSRQSDANSDRISMGTTLVSQNGASMSNSGTENVVDRTVTMTPRFVVDLVDTEQDLFDIPRKERVTYDKDVQTVEFAVEANFPDEEEIVQRITREKEAEAERLAKEREFEAENEKLEQEIRQEIREMTEEEKSTIITDPELYEFVDKSTKFFQRALNDKYDVTFDYTAGTDYGGTDSEGKGVKRICTFFDDRICKNRSITDIDWSPKFPDLTVAAYNKNPAALNEPDGLVAVWSLHLLERPEFVFHSQSDVLSVAFSPFNANLVFGGTYSGQILLWDTRSKHLPVLKTPLSAAGHTHPVYAMQIVGTQNAHNLISSSTDGLICSWLVDMLAQPQETLELQHAGHNKTSEVAITCLNFPDNETTTFFTGTEEGNVYQANRYDRAGAKAGLNQNDVYRGHSAPIMGLHFHPSHGPVDFSDLFLTASADWTVKLWRAKSIAKPSSQPNTIGPVYSFDEADDFVYDVKWHPQHPGLFGMVDGSGQLDLWNLNVDTEVPVVSTVVGSGRAINKLKWDSKEGRRAALGGSDGKLYIYDIGDMAIPRETEWTDLQRTLANMQTGHGGGYGGPGLDGDPSRFVAAR